MEYIRRCNVCGHIWCYTDKDMKENEKDASRAVLSSIGSIANAIGGTRYDAYELDKMSDKSLNKVVNYSKCPNCNSSDTSLITKDILEQIKRVEEKIKVSYFINTPVDEIINKVKMFIEDKNWISAELYLKQLKDRDAKNAEIYLLSIYVENNASNDEELIKNCSTGNKRLFDSENYQYVKKYGSEEWIRKFDKLDSQILENIKLKAEKEKQEIYNSVENIAINSIYKGELKKARKTLTELGNINDYENILKIIDDKLDRIKEIRNSFIKKIFKIIIIAIIILIVIVITVKLVTPLVNKNKLYNEAMSYYENKNYEEAIEILESIPNYKDSDEKKEECKKALEELLKELEENDKKEKYEKATNLLNNGRAFEAYEIFYELEDYSNSKDMAEESLFQCLLLNIMRPTIIFGYKNDKPIYDAFFKAKQEFISNENKIQIKDENKMKEILKGEWCCIEDGIVGNILNDGEMGNLHFFEDGTFTYTCYDDNFLWYWDISDGCFYYQMENSRYKSVDKSEINPKEKGKKCDLYEIVEGEIYRIRSTWDLKNNRSSSSDKMLILKGSKWEKRLEAYINNEK